MRKAIALGAHGGRAVRPNPRVGCVVVNDGVLVGEGFHGRVGGPHAEVVALQSAGQRAAGATLYVTLEPCAHQGRTPPCVDAVIAAGVRRVVVGVVDPHRDAGGGIERLRASGIEVVVGVESAAARTLAEVFLTNVLTGRSHVRLKMAATLDGITAAVDGSSRWITSPDARAMVHAWRADADAVLVGSGTMLQDDPSLDVRHQPTSEQPVRIVFDRRLRMTAAHRLADTSSQQTWLLLDGDLPVDRQRADQLRDLGVRVETVQSRPEHGSWLEAALAQLLEAGLHSVLVEGGATLAGAMIGARVVDRLELLLAPKLLGNGAPLWHALNIGTIDDALPLRIDHLGRVGQDIHVSALFGAAPG
jgi:diaminohydroxyphosphoribosylaminopyrimidine deaminase/5-amino-6-(5-phosphoribosylamino)uracil reductase